MTTAAEALLLWYDRHRRRLPWRALPGEPADPYRVWLSEIMLQQTTVATVGPYFEAFLARWPTVMALAAAPLDEVLTLWAGLGYYARARNLHACAVTVANRYEGRFPDTLEGLRALPGIGAYTAAAVAAIAFGRPAAVVDGNVERVISRLYAIETALPAAKPEIGARAAELTPTQRPGDYAQAMMDLGATLCSPRKPACSLCPFNKRCLAHRGGDPERFPIKIAKPEKPTRRGAVFWARRNDGAVLLVRRPEKGLLGGMIGLPTTEWAPDFDPETALLKPPLPGTWRRLDGLVRHTFTHFHLELTVFAVKVRLGDPKHGLWKAPEQFHELAIPTLFAKAIKHAHKNGG
jgi:A/G-specific adenine glycosylase